MHSEKFEKIINKLFNCLAEAENRERILDTITEPLLTLPGIHTAIIFNAAENFDILRITGLLTAENISPANSRQICRWVIQEGQPLIIQDVRIDPRMNHTLTDPRNRAGGCWPIRVNNRVCWLLYLSSSQIREFTPAEISLIKIITEAAGNRLSCLELQDESKQNRRKLVALEEIIRILNTSLELKTLLNMIIDLTVSLFEVEFSCIYLLDRETNQVELKIARGGDREMLNKLESRFEEKRDFDNLVDIPIKAEGELLGYLTMGCRITGFPETDHELLLTFANLVGVAIRNSLLFAERQKAYRQTITALTMAIEARDKYMHGHTATVGDLSVALGRKMGLDSLVLRDLEGASMLHDIGKLGVAETILNKYGDFTQEEYEEFKKHSEIGAEIVETIEDFSHLAPAIRHHHENYDGTGYPDGLAGQEIPLKARIIAIADAFAVLTSVRYNGANPDIIDALEIIKADAGTRFDPILVEAFEKVVREKHFIKIDRLSGEGKDTDRSETTAQIPDLTERELEILGLIAAGLNNKEISDVLYLSEKTVKTHVSKILKKLNLKDRTKAAVYAIKNGLATLVKIIVSLHL